MSSICKIGFNQCPGLLSKNLFDISVGAHDKNIHKITLYTMCHRNAERKNVENEKYRKEKMSN